MAEPESKRARTEPGEPASAAGVDEESYAVRSADGVVLHWPRQAAERAGTLKNWIEERSGEEETGGERAFPTPLSQMMAAPATRTRNLHSSIWGCWSLLVAGCNPAEGWHLRMASTS